MFYGLKQSPPPLVFVILFGLLIMFILYGWIEVFPYATLQVNTSQPPSLKKWGVKNGYLPLSGNKTLDRHCGQCVLVSSSGHLLGSKLGPTINQAECIIRMNDAPTKGYTADVGSRTTFRMVNHPSVHNVLKRHQEFINKTPETIFIFSGPPHRMESGLNQVIQRVFDSFPNVSAFVVSAKRMEQFDDLFIRETGMNITMSQSWVTAGWITMVIAVELCDQIHVYGMVPPYYCKRKPPPRKLPYHYYEPKGPDECNTYLYNEWNRTEHHHRFITEKRVFAKWARLYNITFYHPDWH